MLEEILASVRSGLPEVEARRDELHQAALAAPPSRDFVAALTGPGLAVIAEIKRRSPSRGVIDSALEPSLLAKQYEAGGAAAVSVLTEPDHFAGSLADLESVRESVGLPVLRKDFILAESQVWQARSAGADSILLIVAVLDDSTLSGLLDTARAVGMEPLVEVHDEVEATRAVNAGARIIGVNNRDLTTFDVDLGTAETIRPLLGDVVAVAESGIWTDEDAGRMRSAGFDAVLVGESLVRADDAASLIAAWSERG